MRYTTIIIGASAAGYSCAQELSRDPQQKVVLIDRSPFMPYNVCRLTSLIKKKCTLESIYLPTNNAVEYLSGTGLREIDSKNQHITLERAEKSSRLSYDKLVLAVGTRPRALPFLENPKSIPTLYFHTLSDATWILDSASRESRVAIIGAGVTGVELAAALSERGVRVILIERAESCLPNLPAGVGRYVTQTLETLGCSVICGEPVDRLTADGIRVSGIEYLIDFAIVTAGVSPATENIGFNGNRTEQGEIITDSESKTTITNIFAIGDCAARLESALIIRPTYRWGNAIAQGITLGRELRGDPYLPIKAPSSSTTQIGPLMLTWSGTYSYGNHVEKIQSDKSIRWCWHNDDQNVAGFVQMSMLDGTEVFV